MGSNVTAREENIVNTMRLEVVVNFGQIRHLIGRRGGKVQNSGVVETSNHNQDKSSWKKRDKPSPE